MNKTIASQILTRKPQRFPILSHELGDGGGAYADQVRLR
jgi:hypothetical protein